MPIICMLTIHMEYQVLVFQENEERSAIIV